MIYAKNLSLKLWAEAVSHAVFLLNRTAPTGCPGKCAWDLWSGRKQRLISSELRIFGEECYAHIPQQKRRKWDAKSQQGIFVGLAENVKGYRIYIPATQKVEVKHDVIFKPFLSSSQDASLIVNCTDDAVCAGDDKSDPLPAKDVVKGEDPEMSVSDSIFESTDQQSDDEPQPRNTNQESIKSRLRNAKNVNLESMMALLELRAFVAEKQDPATFDEALQSKDANKWKHAMTEEIAALHKNHTWDLVELPQNTTVIDNRWVYKIKDAVSNEPKRYRARLVVKGYTQKYDIDYKETFSPVAKFSSIRSIFAIASHKKMSLRQFDIKTAFLYGDVQEELYMKQPKGFEDGSDRVCRLRRSLYGLKQASRCWNEKFSEFLRSFDLKSTDADPCVFVRENLIVAIYVDDGLIAGVFQEDIRNLIQHLQNSFEVKIYEARCFLGLEINRKMNGSISVSQSSYAEKIVSKFNITDAHPVATPIDASTLKDEVQES